MSTIYFSGLDRSDYVYLLRQDKASAMGGVVSKKPSLIQHRLWEEVG